jgi:hypothetical protein
MNYTWQEEAFEIDVTVSLKRSCSRYYVQGYCKIDLRIKRSADDGSGDGAARLLLM